MRTDPIANFENAGDSGATQYPKKKMSCTNLPHRKVDFSNSGSDLDTYFLGTQPEQKFKNLSEIESDGEQFEGSNEEEDGNSELMNRFESTEKRANDISNIKDLNLNDTSSLQKSNSDSGSDLNNNESDLKEESSDILTDSEMDEEVENIQVNSPTKSSKKSNLGVFAKTSTLQGSELETIPEKTSSKSKNNLDVLPKPSALKVDAKSKSSNDNKGIRKIVPMTKERKVTSDQTTVTRKLEYKSISLDKREGNYCPLHDQMIILFATLLTKSDSYSESIKLLEQYGLAYLEDMLSRANVYKLLAINHILIQTPGSYTKAMKY